MPPTNQEPTLTPASIKACPWYQPLCKVTPLSKYLAMVIFIAAPFVGGYIGYKLAPVNVLEVPVVTNVISNNHNVATSSEISTVSAEATTSDYVGLFTISFSSNPVDVTELLINSTSTKLTKAVDATGWTLTSDKTKNIFTFTELHKVSSKYGVSTSTSPIPLIFNQNGAEDITVKVTQATTSDVVITAEGGNSYRFFVKKPIWDSTHDTLTLRDRNGQVVTKFIY